MEGLLADPDSPKDERFIKYLYCGFGLASAISFHALECQGIVIFLARPQASIDRLSIIENKVYMVTSSQIIGSTLASTHARRACSLVRSQMGEVAAAVITEDEKERKMQSDTSGDQETKERPFHRRHFRDESVRRFLIWIRKCRGGSTQIPPRMSTDECIYTLFGVFCGLLVLSTMNMLTRNLTDKEYYLLLPPFGALMTLQYGLTAAPASQPRNTILGQAVAGAVSLSFTYIPEDILPIWLRLAVGPAFAITAMVLLGIPHPPAGAHSVMYASGEYSWTLYSLVVLASVISVIPATLVNNLSRKRQYPTYLGYAPKLLGKVRHRNSNV